MPEDIEATTPFTTVPVIRTIAMPADTNPAGDIFGGWLMGQMDLAAGNVAALRARGRCATVAVDAMTFHSPVFVGDEGQPLCADHQDRPQLDAYSRVEAWRRARDSEARNKVTHATFTFVAIDDDRRSRPLPTVDE